MAADGSDAVTVNGKAGEESCDTASSVYSIESADSDEFADVEAGLASNTPLDNITFMHRLTEGLRAWEHLLSARKRSSTYVKVGRSCDKPRRTVRDQIAKQKRRQTALRASGFPDIRDSFKRQKLSSAQHIAIPNECNTKDSERGVHTLGLEDNAIEGELLEKEAEEEEEEEEEEEDPALPQAPGPFEEEESEEEAFETSTLYLVRMPLHL